MKPSQVISVIMLFLFSFVGSSIFLTLREKSLLPNVAGAAAISESVAGPQYVSGVLLSPIDTSAIEAASFVVGTASGVVLAENNSALRVPMASLTKIMTGLLLEKYGKRAIIQITETNKLTPARESPLPAGETLNAKTAKVLLLVESDNDVAEAIANAVGPLTNNEKTPRDAFIDEMNTMAREIGLTGTRFKNPTGLDEPGHYSTASDLLTLVRYIDSQYPEFWAETALPPKFIQSLSGHRYTIKSSSLLVSYPGIIGMKTGLTNEALGALVIRYRITGFPEDLIIVLLHSSDRFRDGENLLKAVRRTFHDVSI